MSAEQFAADAGLLERGLKALKRVPGAAEKAPGH